MVEAREECFKNGVINHVDAAKRLVGCGQKLVPLDMAVRQPAVALTREVLVEYCG